MACASGGGAEEGGACCPWPLGAWRAVHSPWRSLRQKARRAPAARGAASRPDNLSAIPGSARLSPQRLFAAACARPFPLARAQRPSGGGRRARKARTPQRGGFAAGTWPQNAAAPPRPIGFPLPAGTSQKNRHPSPSSRDSLGRWHRNPLVPFRPMVPTPRRRALQGNLLACAGTNGAQIDAAPRKGQICGAIKEPAKPALKKEEYR